MDCKNENIYIYCCWFFYTALPRIVATFAGMLKIFVFTSNGMLKWNVIYCTLYYLFICSVQLYEDVNTMQRVHNFVCKAFLHEVFVDLKIKHFFNLN